MVDHEEGETTLRLDTTGGMLFSSGNTDSFCCQGWEIEALQRPENRGTRDAKESLALTLLSFINGGKVKKQPPFLMQKDDIIESAKWLVVLRREDVHPELRVYLAAKGSHEDGIQEICRGKDCFGSNHAVQRAKWKMGWYEMIEIKLVCPVHDVSWECDIVHKKISD